MGRAVMETLRDKETTQREDISWVKDIMLQRYTLVLQKRKPGLRMPTPCEIEDLGRSTQYFVGGQILDLPAD